MESVGVAVVGAGYWGPNLVRNFAAADGTEIRWVCDLSISRAEGIVGQLGGTRFTDSLDEVLADDSVDAIAVATPASTHAEIALAALAGGRHVLIEKPLAESVDEAQAIVDAADAAGVVLMTDHTYCYTPAVRKIKQIIDSGELGEVQYFDSVRINLGLIQSDVDVFWDLGPHDLSILDYLIPHGSRPVSVAAHAADPLGVGHACVGYMTLPLANGGIAHSHLNWLSPTKIRTTIIGGTKQMLVWDDLQPSQRIQLYDTTVDYQPQEESVRRDQLVAYRSGDMVAPAIPEREALRSVVDEFIGAINEKRAPLTDGHAGLRVVETLTAVRQSLLANGALQPIGRL